MSNACGNTNTCSNTTPTQYPSLFNDVIGPVMVGPSSSHTAASVRIGGMVRQFCRGLPKEVVFGFDLEGSLAETYTTQGVDLGLLAGLMGLETSDPQIAFAHDHAKQAGLNCRFECGSFGGEHPNTYHIQCTGTDSRTHAIKAVSSGGGMIEIIEYQGFSLSITGGFYEALFPCPDGMIPDGLTTQSGAGLQPGTISGGLLTQSGSDLPPDGTIPGGPLIRSDANLLEHNGAFLLHLRSDQPLGTLPDEAVLLSPVLPVSSQLVPGVPFDNWVSAQAWMGGRPMTPAELAVTYESGRSGLTAAEVFQKMQTLVDRLSQSLVESPVLSGDVLPVQSHLATAHPLPGAALNEKIIQNVTRFMEIKAAMGVVVAAPTGGACGCLPGTVFALAEALGLGQAAAAEAMLAGGLVGVFIARNSTFAAEVAGCQAECGAGSGMCAAACVQLMGGTVHQAMDAASMALQNVLGMVCDPVAGRVEVPCLGKNILCALGGLAAAQMAVCGYDAVIPLDETIAAMDSVGRSIPRELRCTGLAGLSVTPASKALEEKLKKLEKR